jgi:hypothetical protein
MKEEMMKLQSSDERPTRMKFRTGPAERWLNGVIHDSRTTDGRTTRTSIPAVSSADADAYAYADGSVRCGW